MLFFIFRLASNLSAPQSITAAHYKRVWGSVLKMKGQNWVWKPTFFFHLFFSLKPVIHHPKRETSKKKKKQPCRHPVRKLLHRKHVIYNCSLAERLYSLRLIMFDIKCVTNQLRPLEKWKQDLKSMKWEVWMLDVPLLSTAWPEAIQVTTVHFSLHLLLMLPHRIHGIRLKPLYNAVL